MNIQNKLPFLKNIKSLYIKKKKVINILLALLLILILSSLTRFYKLGDPQGLVFDENYFIPIIQKYIRGEFIAEPHPPLGQLLMTSGTIVFSQNKTNVILDPNYDNIGTYRITSILFGIFIPIIVFFLTKFFTKSNAFSLLSGLLIVFDNALIVQTRYALFDEIMILFILTSLLFTLYYIRYVKSAKLEIFKKKNISKRFFLLILASVFAGLALSTKLIGIMSTGFLYLSILYKTYKDRYKLDLKTNVFIILQLIIPAFIISGIFLFSYYIHFSLFKLPGENIEEFSPEYQECIYKGKNECKLSLIQKVKENINWSLNYEKHVPALDYCKDDEIGSNPYEWPFMSRTISYFFTNYDGIPLKEISYIYLFGNPINWFLGLTGLIISLSLVFASIFHFKSFVNKNILIILFCYFVSFVPYFFIERVMYFYHYLLSFIFSIILFVVILQLFYHKHLKYRLNKILKILLFLIFNLIIIISFLIYSPLTYNIKININYAKKINILKIWHFKADPFNYEKN